MPFTTRVPSSFSLSITPSISTLLGPGNSSTATFPLLLTSLAMRGPLLLEESFHLNEIAGLGFSFDLSQDAEGYWDAIDDESTVVQNLFNYPSQLCLAFWFAVRSIVTFDFVGNQGAILQ